MSEPYEAPGPAGTGPGPAGAPGPVRLPGSGAEPGAGPQPGPLASVPEATAHQPEPPEQPRPLGVTVAATGNAEVDAVLERLGDADELPTGGHIEVYEDVHQALREALASLDGNRG